MDQKQKKLVIVRGIGDVGSAICWMLHKNGWAVIAHENRQPKTIRRKMAFCDAIWSGEAELDGVTCQRTDTLEDRDHYTSLQTRPSFQLFTGEFAAMVNQLTPDILIDARIQKHTPIAPLKDLAALTIGIGPGFVAKDTVDLVIESCWGPDLGHVIHQGSARDVINQPPKMRGTGWERFIRAPADGHFETHAHIGDLIKEGDIIAHLNGVALMAPISGHIRGLLYSGQHIEKGEKLAEIDPRGEQAHYAGLAERPREIAKGVLEAIEGSLG